MEQAASLGVFGALKKMMETFDGLLPVLVLVSLIAGVWIYFFAVARHEPTWLDWKEGVRSILRFDVMFWPLLGRILYLSISVFLLLSGIITMIAVNLLGGLVGMALLLIFVRILFEMTLVLFSIHERLILQEQKAERESFTPTPTSSSPSPSSSLSSSLLHRKRRLFRKGTAVPSNAAFTGIAIREGDAVIEADTDEDDDELNFDEEDEESLIASAQPWEEMSADEILFPSRSRTVVENGSTEGEPAKSTESE